MAFALLAVLLSAAHAHPTRARAPVIAASDAVALLIPDNVEESDPRLLPWWEAAKEEGLLLHPLRESEFMRMPPDARRMYGGIILPDSLQPRASDSLVAAITDFVVEGGNIMLVYDFGSLTDTGFYAPVRSRLSALAGVDYVLYDELLDRTIGIGPVTGQAGTLRALGVPPGKSSLYAASAPGGLGEQVVRRLQDSTVTYLAPGPNSPGGQDGFDPTLSPAPGLPATMTMSRHHLHEEHERLKGLHRVVSKARVRGVTRLPSAGVHGISGYVYGFLDYPSFVTRGAYAGTPLLTSPDFGLVAGLNNVGAGRVLFVNTPLAYLKSRTDGMLLHGFLRYFAADVVKAPLLAKTPDGIGGLTFNWHVDDSSAINAIAELDRRGVWRHGPFSLHFTAGPDVDFAGDGLGMDLANNETAQGYVRRLARLGHRIGSHGGWIHNAYGLFANEYNQDEFLPLLEVNHNVVSAVLGEEPTEYSPPQGNNPQWALDWLEAKGITAYYTGGHTGLSATRNVLDWQVRNPGMWAFPVTPFGRAATFEEFEELGVRNADVIQWYKDLVEYSSAARASYMIYAHPPAATRHPDLLAALLSFAKRAERGGAFRWYPMTDLASFLSIRRQTDISRTPLPDGWVAFRAENDKGVAGLTWTLPAAAYGCVRLAAGEGSVRRNKADFVVSGQSGTVLEFHARRGPATPDCS